METALREIFESMLGEAHVAFPAKVESFDPLQMRANLAPCFKSKYKNIGESDWPILQEVPVMFVSSGDFHVLYQPKAGSYGICIVAEKSLDEFLIDGRIALPSDNRAHDLSDAVFIPGIFPLTSVAGFVAAPIASSAMEIRNTANTVAIKLSASGIDITGNATVALGNDITVYSTANAAGVPIPGTLVPVGVAAHKHTHICAYTGAPVTSVGPEQ